MQKEGVVPVFLPRPASHVHASVLPCVEAPLSASTVLTVDAGALLTGALLSGEYGRGLNTGVLGDRGGVRFPGVPISSCSSPDALTGGEYSDDTSVPPWLRVDAAL